MSRKEMNIQTIIFKDEKKKKKRKKEYEGLNNILEFEFPLH